MVDLFLVLMELDTTFPCAEEKEAAREVDKKGKADDRDRNAFNKLRCAIALRPPGTVSVVEPPNKKRRVNGSFPKSLAAAARR